MKKLIVQQHNSDIRTPLRCIVNSSFYEHWESGNTWELQLTVYDDGSPAFNMLSVEASLWWDDQEFIIKSWTPDYSGGITTSQIVATHVYAEISRIRQYNTKTGTLTYSPKDVLSFYLDDKACNVLGYTYEVIGSFINAQITDLGNNSGQDMLAQILDTWPTAVIFPDNKNIRVYSANEFGKDYGNRIDYLHDTEEVTLEYDSTGITNSTKAIGATKDDDSDNDSDTESYYFEPFIVQDSDSIGKWGIHSTDDVDDERFTDANNIKAYALTQLVSEPSLSIEIKSKHNFKPIAGEIRRLEIRPVNYVTKVQVLEYQYYPYDSTQPTDIVLNNTAKTILDYQSKQASSVTNLVEAQKQKILNLTNKIGTLTTKTNDVSKTTEDMQTTIDQLKKDLESLQNSSDTGSGSTWTSGSIFVDLSSNNGQTPTIDQPSSWYANLAANNCKGAMVKLTQGSEAGSDYVNPLFDSQVTNIKNSGMKFIGAYHYLKAVSVSDAQAEAQWFVKELMAKSISTSVVVACDVEDASLTNDKATLTSMVKAFHQIVSDAGYINTADYTSASWLTSRFTSTAKHQWIASWRASTAPTGAEAWQWTDKWLGLSLDANYSLSEAFV